MKRSSTILAAVAIAVTPGAPATAAAVNPAAKLSVTASARAASKGEHHSRLANPVWDKVAIAALVAIAVVVTVGWLSDGEPDSR